MAVPSDAAATSATKVTSSVEPSALTKPNGSAKNAPMMAIGPGTI
jgi:hypothetical protein